MPQYTQFRVKIQVKGTAGYNNPHISHILVLRKEFYQGYDIFQFASVAIDVLRQCIDLIDN